MLQRGGYFDTEGCLHNNEGNVRCTAIVHSTSKRCKNFSAEGQTICKFHGGANLAKRNAKGASIYSCFLQDNTLAEVYRRSMETDQNQTIRNELGLMRGLLATCVKTLAEDEITPKLMKDISMTIGEIRMLMDACMKQEIRMGNLIDVAQVAVVVKQIIDVLTKHIKDKDLLEDIANEFDRINWPGSFATTPQPSRQKPFREVQDKTTFVRGGSSRGSVVGETAGSVEVLDA